MSFSLGNNIKIAVSGASHSESIDVEITGLPSGTVIDMDEVMSFLKRRQGGNASYTTKRKEADEPIIKSGFDNLPLEQGRVATGKLVINNDPIFASFKNSNVRKDDYKSMRVVPRPSHADYVAYEKYKGNLDMSGGGFFSGRMTLPMCFAGAICIQLLRKYGVDIGAHIYSVGSIKDDKYDPVGENMEILSDCAIPVINKDSGEKMISLMEQISKEGDSIGGIIECKVTGLPVGLGDPIYDSVESIISYGMFGIPAIKGIEFGLGFGVSEATGSGSNDGFYIRNGKVKCITNNSGGIQGGITNGMPIIFRVAVKPTPSIYKEQKSVDLCTMTETTLQIAGRHDSCIVPRVVPCVEAMCALMICDIIQTQEG